MPFPFFIKKCYDGVAKLIINEWKDENESEKIVERVKWRIAHLKPPKSIHVTNDSLTFVRHPLRQSINKQGSLSLSPLQFFLDDDDDDDDDENCDLSRWEPTLNISYFITLPTTKKPTVPLFAKEDDEMMNS